MNIFVYLACFQLVIVSYGSVAKEPSFYSDEFLEIVRTKAKTWEVSRIFKNLADEEAIREMIAVYPLESNTFQFSTKKLVARVVNKTPTPLPRNFHSSTKWPNCPSIKKIHDKGNCLADWAIAPLAVMSDRICIRSNGKFRYSLSAQDVMTCCHTCGYGCHGGDASSVWNYWKVKGIVTETCRPYNLPRDSVCKHQCQNTHTPFQLDKHFGESVYYIANDTLKIQQEIFENGPVEAVMTVYEDFMTYKGGVYRHAHGKIIGRLSVRILGWGWMCNSSPHWIVANSFGPNWGVQGIFNIVRGENHCGIESEVRAGIPKIN